MTEKCQGSRLVVTTRSYFPVVHLTRNCKTCQFCCSAHSIRTRTGEFPAKPCSAQNNKPMKFYEGSITSYTVPSSQSSSLIAYEIVKLGGRRDEIWL